MTAEQLQSLFLALAAVLVLARVLGTAARWIGQPPVVGEITAGILVGPTLLDGVIADHLFPGDIRPMLGALANLGLVFFMFVIGHELDLKLLRGHEKVAASISLCSVVLPFGLGALLGLWLAGRHAPGSELGFVLFLGSAMSVTAFPVLARILADSGLRPTRVGGVALASAAVDDIVAWSLLAVVAGVAGGGGQWRMLLAPVYLAVMYAAVRPLLARLLRDRGDGRGIGADQLIVVLGGLMLSCWATEWLGLHFIFGAFLFGVVMPRQISERAHRQITERVEYLSRLLLLPAFFIVAGMKVDLSGTGLRGLGELSLILLVAVTGKFAGAYAGARANRVPRTQSGVLAVLMNTRGLTEIVILTVGLQLAVIDTGMYSLMVIMALVTTAMAGPLLYVLRRRGGGLAALGAFGEPAPQVGTAAADVKRSVPVGRGPGPR
ncbi:Na(+)/H(+)-K(+) antiporter GerN [Streptomyces sp. RB5]|uniref:Na(+)/H(+)-K(+) antiporter GerN n=1 Tax=Streptomyces smaragdinus TaxID=2585196 RepID=A0A7K0CE35_9ACTN|nr:cation:proton antiporter [Streptomyces smaragdinus]MQY11626.1 Na(+)/H(+)-K(+) antiporter GerN [Streptomyces smaragdinus]